MYNCKECKEEINLTDKTIYSDDGQSFDCPECNATHTQIDIIAPPQNYKCPTPDDMSKFITESFPTLHPIVNEMDAIYGVFTDMFKVLVDRIETLEANDLGKGESDTGQSDNE